MSQESVLEVIFWYQIWYLLNRIGKSNIVEPKVNEWLKKVETLNVAQYSIGPRTITPTMTILVSLQMVQQLGDTLERTVGDAGLAASLLIERWRGAKL